MRKSRKNVSGAQGANATIKKAKVVKQVNDATESKRIAAVDQKTTTIDHLRVITTIVGCKQFLNQYRSLPFTGHAKIETVVNLMNNKDTRFKITQYPRISDKGYTYYELTRYSLRENVNPTRMHIPAIDLVKRLIDIYYNSNDIINIDMQKLISHCESRIVKSKTNSKATRSRAKRTVKPEESSN